jgi:hypothetical protein
MERVDRFYESLVVDGALAPDGARDVAAAAERGSLATEDDAPDGGIGLGPGERVEELVARPAGTPGDRVQRVGAIENEVDDAVASVVVPDLVELHSLTRSTPGRSGT